jgi:predicted secreted protein
MKVGSIIINPFFVSLVLITGFLWAPYANAQLNPAFMRTYGGDSSDVCWSLASAPDGGFVLVGQTASFGAGYDDLWVVRVSKDGDSLWSRTYGGKYPDVCRTVIRCNDGGYALAGETMSYGPKWQNFWLVRLDSCGYTQWWQDYGGDGTDICFAVVQTPDSGFAMTGWTTSYGAGGSDYWLVKADVNGDQVWSKTYGGRGDDECYGIAPTGDGGFALAGLTNSFGAGGTDAWLVRTDSRGDSLWSGTYGTEGNERCHSIIQTADSGFVIAGSSDCNAADSVDFWALRTDRNGKCLWTKTYGGRRRDVAYSVIASGDGGFILSGCTESFGAGQSDIWTIGIDEYGDSLWSQTYGGKMTDYCYAASLTSDRSLIIAGSTASFGVGKNDFCLIKVSLDSIRAPKIR